MISHRPRLLMADAYTLVAELVKQGSLHHPHTEGDFP
jgi:hypothetical protein